MCHLASGAMENVVCPAEGAGGGLTSGAFTPVASCMSQEMLCRHSDRRLGHTLPRHQGFGCSFSVRLLKFNVLFAMEEFKKLIQNSVSSVKQNSAG